MSTFPLGVMPEGLGGCYPVVIFWGVTMMDTGGLSHRRSSAKTALLKMSARWVSDILVLDAVLLCGRAVMKAPVFAATKALQHNWHFG
eukprot:692379-Pelagomonas_calceolata.AAC.1